MVNTAVEIEVVGIQHDITLIVRLVEISVRKHGGAIRFLVSAYGHSVQHPNKEDSNNRKRHHARDHNEHSALQLTGGLLGLLGLCLIALILLIHI